MEIGRKPDVEWANELLGFVQASCDRDKWLRIGAAIKNGLGEEGWPAFDAWSQSAPNIYDPADCRRTWDSLSPNGGVTWGTLVYLATEGGLRPQSGGGAAGRKEWAICDEAGHLVATHYRTKKQSGSKGFGWKLPDGTSGLAGRKTKTLPLYGTELLASTAAQVIVITEGEKAADALRAAEPTVLVLGTVTGSSATPDAAVFAPVVATGLPVYLWPDADVPGAKHMERLAARILEAGGKSPAIIAWHDAPEKGDAADWAAAGKQPAFKDLTAAAEKWIRPKPKQDRTQAAEGRGRAPTTQEMYDDYDTTSMRCAERLLLKHRGELLVVTDEQHELSDLYVLGENGIWLRGSTTIKRWMSEDADALRVQAVTRDKLDGKVLTGVLDNLRRLYEPGTLKPIREQAVPALKRLIASGKLKPEEVTTCLNTDLDSNMRYLGTLTGVVDLHTGRQLPPEEGRKYLVTYQAPTPYDPDATHPDVDRLFAHLSDPCKDWWWEVLGYHLLGAPSRRIYLVVGPPKGGKSTLFRALQETLGPYVSKPDDGVLEHKGKQNKHETQLSPGVKYFVPPYRLALLSDVQVERLNTNRMKEWSGQGSAAWRELHEKLRTDPITATMMLACNQTSVPQVGLHDEAMRDRVRVLPYPALPEELLDPSFIHERIKAEPFRKALLARLVAEAKKAKPGAPPEEPEEVSTATLEQVTEDVGELGALAERIIPCVGERLTVAEVWEAWCEHNDENGDVTEAGGISKRRLTRALRNHVQWLPAPRAFSLDGKKVRGWRDWKLLTVEEWESTQTVEQAIRRLTVDYPGVSFFGTPLGPQPLYYTLKRLRDVELFALQDWFHNGRGLADALKQSADLVSYDGEGEERTAAHSIREAYPDLSEEHRAAVWFVQTIANFAWTADNSRELGPVCEQIRDRYNAIEGKKMSHGFAWNLLKEADRELGPAADTEALVRKAVELLIDEFNRMPPKYAERYDVTHLEDAIRELAGSPSRDAR